MFIYTEKNHCEDNQTVTSVLTWEQVQSRTGMESLKFLRTQCLRLPHPIFYAGA